jgi:hypothetical protein
MKVISGQGEAIFEREYTTRRKPCIFVNFPNAWHNLEIYLTEDKQHLYYSYDVTMYQKIIFARLPNPK